MLRDVAMATNFGTQFAITGFVEYNFGCMMASDTLFDPGWVFGVKLFDEDIADFKVLRDIATTTIFLALYIWGAHWRHLKNMTEPSMCGGDEALCQITLTTCLFLFHTP